MNSKYILSFLAGAAVGALVMYIVEEKRNKIEFEEFTIDNGDDFFDEDDDEMIDEEIEREPIKVKMPTIHTQDNIIKNNGYNPRKKNYAVKSKVLTDAEIDQMNGETKTEEHQAEVDRGDIYLISEDVVGIDGRETAELIYYAGDDTLTTEEEEVIEDRKLNIGDIDIAGAYDSGHNYLYVRNEKLGVDYEITCVYSSFADIASPEEGE